ncbi:MAG: hypothetical protein WCW02_00310 [Candidatus Buchananbacteria bacterium]
MSAVTVNGVIVRYFDPSNGKDARDCYNPNCNTNDPLVDYLMVGRLMIETCERHQTGLAEAKKVLEAAQK